MMTTRRVVPGLVLVTLAAAAPHEAAADVFCKKKKGAVVVRQSCKPRETPLNLSDFGVAGPAGPAGPAGADAQVRIYGDGSGGAKIVATDEMLADANVQYTDFTVNPGVTLTVSSGTLIRCTGTFTNGGTVRVNRAASGGFRGGAILFGPVTAVTEVAPHAGVAFESAQSGDVGDAGATRNGGIGAFGLGEVQARGLLSPGLVGGGGGAAAGFNLGATATVRRIGSAGGGSLVVLAQGGVDNSGTIEADGNGGEGAGGAGGVVVLASRTQVTNATGAVITATGGQGKDSDEDEGASGGGGGGIVHLLAPIITGTGTIDVDGGAAGAAGGSGSVTTSPRSAGSGGGACGGNGGNGGSVSTGGTPEAASPGSAGHDLQTMVDPTALF